MKAQVSQYINPHNKTCASKGMSIAAKMNYYLNMASISTIFLPGKKED